MEFYRCKYCNKEILNVKTWSQFKHAWFHDRTPLYHEHKNGAPICFGILKNRQNFYMYINKTNNKCKKIIKTIHDIDNIIKTGEYAEYHVELTGVLIGTKRNCYVYFNNVT